LGRLTPLGGGKLYQGPVLEFRCQVVEGVLEDGLVVVEGVEDGLTDVVEAS